MNLISSMLKLGSILKAKIREAVYATEDRHEELTHDSKSVACNCNNVEQFAVILEEKTRQVRIACWNCSKSLWVSRGSECHRTGLCGNCI